MTGTICPSRDLQAAVAGGGGRHAASRAGLRLPGGGSLSRLVEAAGRLRDGALQAMMLAGALQALTVAVMVAPMVEAALEAKGERTVEVRGERAAVAAAVERVAVAGAAVGSVGVGPTVAGMD